MLDFLNPIILAIEDLWRHHRWVFYVGGAYGLFMAFTSALPAPNPDNDKGYRILYNICHVVSVNIAKVVPWLRLPERKG